MPYTSRKINFRILVGLVFLMPLVGLAQNEIYVPYEFPKTISKEYQVVASQEYNKIVSNIQGEDLSQRDKKRFAEEIAYGKADMFYSGNVYIDWKEVENYLNEVLQTVLPEKYKDNKKIHAYPTRDPFINAYASHDGTLYVNIGLLAEMKDEAGLAIIIGHEISHYLHKDIINHYKKGLKLYTKKNRNDNYQLKIGYAAVSREDEKKADKSGFEMAYNAGYSLNSGITNFNTFLEFEKKVEDANSDDDETIEVVYKNDSKEKGGKGLLNSHPETVTRINDLNKYIKELGTKDGEKYIVSEERFSKIKSMCITESLDLLLRNHHYTTAIERSFKHFLLNPENDQYLYYLLESMRRKFLSEEDAEEEVFLGDVYGNFLDEKTGILKQLDLVFRSTDLIEQIKINEIKDTSSVEFVTYNDAFKYFEKFISSESYSELYLTMALKNRANDTLKQEFIKKYLASNSPKHVQYALAYSDNELSKKLESNKTELLVAEPISFIEDHVYGLRNKRIKEEKSRETYFGYLEEQISKSFHEKEIINLGTLSSENINYSIALKEAMLGSILLQEVKKEETSVVLKKDEESKDTEKKANDAKTIYFEDWANTSSITEAPLSKVNPRDFFVLNPSYWELFKEKKIKSIAYMQTIAVDDKTRIAKDISRLIFLPLSLLYGTEYGYIATGSRRYGYFIRYYSFDFIEKKRSYSKSTVNYKLTKEHFANTVYHTLSDE